MKIVITGSESFIGKELRRRCRNAGIGYVGFDMATSDDPNQERLNICDPEVDGAIPEGTDAIIHLAAISTEKACRENPRLAFDVNVGGTLNLLKAAQKRNVKQVIFASSEWVYGEVANGAVQREETFIDANGVSSEYALTKLAGERVLWMANARESLSCTVLRFGIVYGPRPGNWSAVEHLFHAVRTKDLVEVGSLATARRFIHVSDIASGILSVVGRPGYEIFNLSGDHLVTLREVIEQSSALAGRRPRIVEKDPDHPSIRNPDNARALALLPWKPKIGLPGGLKTLMEL